MVHADSAAVPASIKTKAEFYEHLNSSLTSLLSGGQRTWITNLANASSLLYFSLNEWRRKALVIQDPCCDKGINWAGFYLITGIFPDPKPKPLEIKKKEVPTVVLGPFHGMPACQAIPSVVGKGVCADASANYPAKPIVVKNVDEYPGHIACDSLSKSELVIPLVVPISSLKLTYQESIRGKNDIHWAGRLRPEKPSVLTRSDAKPPQDDLRAPITIGLLDIDCVDEDGFDETDVQELQKFADIIAKSCAW